MDPAIHSTLRRKQRRLVRENPGVLGALVRGANMAIAECQHQFRHRRWNCSTRNFLRGKNLFGKIVDRGKEFRFLIDSHVFFGVNIWHTQEVSQPFFLAYSQLNLSQGYGNLDFTIIILMMVVFVQLK